MSSFEEIGRESGTDKVYHHGYQRFYPRFLESIRDIATGILEIGIHRGASLNLWLRYFNKAIIHAIDITVQEYNSDRVKLFKADQSSPSDLERVTKSITDPVQFIIDDGSHVPEHQRVSFEYLFKNLLQPGGVYIVEDIEISYWNNEEHKYGYKSSESFIERVKPLIDVINNEFLNSTNKDQSIRDSYLSREVCDMISTMTFGQNCVIFTKKTLSEMEYNNRVYRFSGFI